MPKKKEQPESLSRFIVDGATYEIDADHLTWGEVESVEKYFDKAMGDVNLASARGVMVLAYLAVKRKRPSVTMDYIRGLEMSQIEAVDVERPTEPQPEASGSQS